MMKSFLKYAFLLFITAWLVWFKLILYQPLAGESFMYFQRADSLKEILVNEHPLESSFNRISGPLYRFGVYFFKDNITDYRIMELLIVYLLALSLYLFLYISAESKFIAFWGSVSFLSTFNGVYEMLSGRYFSQFTERVPALTLSFISLTFLARYIKAGEKLFLLFSFLSFAISLYLAHFSTFLIPLFAIFPVCFTLSTRKKEEFPKSLIKPLFITLVFVVLTKLMIAGSQHYPKGSFTDFLAPSNRPFERVAFQIPNLLVPFDFIEFVRKDGFYKMSNDIPVLFRAILIFLAILGFNLSLKIYKRDKKIFAVFISLLLSLLGYMLLYAYVDSRMDPINGYGQSRMNFISAILWGALSAIVLNELVLGIKLKKYIVAALFLLFYGITFISIKQVMDKDEHIFADSNNWIKYYKEKSAQIPNNSIVILSSKLLWTAPYLSTFYSPKDTEFVLLKDDWKKIYKKERRNIFAFDFDEKKHKIIETTKER